MTEAETNELVKIISQYGWHDDPRYKQWVLDQVVRKLKGDGYKSWRGVMGNFWSDGIKLPDKFISTSPFKYPEVVSIVGHPETLEPLIQSKYSASLVGFEAFLDHKTLEDS